MANNFLRYKLLMLSRASFEMLYVAVEPINLYINMFSSPQIAPAHNVEVAISTQLNISPTANVADTAHTEIKISDELGVECGVGVAGVDNISVENNEHLTLTCNPTVFGAVSTKTKISHNLNVECGVTLLRHIYYPVVNIRQLLEVNCSADIATFIKTSVDTGTQLNVSPTANVADTAHTEIKISDELGVECGVGVATPIDTGVLSSTYSSLAVGYKTSATTNIGMRGEKAVTIKANSSLFRRTRLLDLNGILLSAVSNKDLGYTAANGIYLTEII